MSASSNLKLNKKLEKIYYSPKGYWRGYSAIKRLSTVAGVSEEEAKVGLKNKQCSKFIFRLQVIFHVQLLMFLFPMRYIKLICSSCHMITPLRSRKTYKYALTVVDVASRYKEAEPLTTKESAEVAKAFSTIYKRSRLKVA